ncbi:MAG: chemotaxis protein CheA [Deltaproteobacteria bacterium]|nr:MAG: chemotaxis protein CheA [Deltaproteobacteria bacterium]
MADRDRNIEEFLSEAQEVVESFSRCLETLDRQLREGEVDPDVVNSAFRAVHSLKGTAGIFGADAISQTSHVLESVLDRIRLGKAQLSPDVLDDLFAAVDVFSSQLEAYAAGKRDVAPPSDFLERLSSLAGASEAPAEDASLAGLDPSVLGVLTEYEEHRLRENVRMGRTIFRVHALFDLAELDKGIETLKQKLKNFGEVITYLPSMDDTAPDRIALDVLVGSKCTLAEIAAAVAGEDVEVHRTGEETGAQAVATEGADQGGASVPSPKIPSGTLQPAMEHVATPAIAPSPSAGAEDDAKDSATDDAGDEVGLRSLSQTVRVDLRRLDALMNLVGELRVVHASVGGVLDEAHADIPSDVLRDLGLQLRTMERKLSMLQQAILDIRMVPIGHIFDKLGRVVRKISRETDKDVRLVVSGGDTELDKLIAEEISAPLVHMVRNCIDHGIESPTERVAAGKPAVGRIDLRAFPKGNRVVIEVEDDGRGMDWRAIRDRAVERGLIPPHEAEGLSPAAALELVFLPGFTTRDTTSTVSGRGVGMDVVKTNVTNLSGIIDVSTEPGRGTKFAITLPVSLAIIQALVVEAVGHTFCLPLSSVLEAALISESEILTVEGHEVVTMHGKTLPLLHLARLFELPGADRGYLDPEQIHVVVIGVAQHRVGLVVDFLRGQQDVVVKPLGRALRGVPGVAGATELGANRTVLLLDVASLVQGALRDAARALYRPAGTYEGGESRVPS